MNRDSNLVSFSLFNATTTSLKVSKIKIFRMHNLGKSAVYKECFLYIYKSFIIFFKDSSRKKGLIPLNNGTKYKATFL